MMSAASGIRMTALRKNVVKPNVSPKPGKGLGARGSGRQPCSGRSRSRARSGPAAGAVPRAASRDEASRCPRANRGPRTSIEFASSESSFSSSTSRSPNRSSVRRSSPCSACAAGSGVEEQAKPCRAFALRRTRAVDGKQHRLRWDVAEQARRDAEHRWLASAPGRTTIRAGSVAPTGSTNTWVAPCARFQSAVALAPGPAASTGMPGGALAVRVMRVVMRVCMRVASVARSGVSRSASAAAVSRAITVKLEIGVGSMWMRRALTVTRCPVTSGFARCSGNVRVASSSHPLPSAPSRSGVAGMGPSIGMRTRRRSVAPENCSSATVPTPTWVRPSALPPVVSSTSSGRMTATISRGVTDSVVGRSKRSWLPLR